MSRSRGQQLAQGASGAPIGVTSGRPVPASNAAGKRRAPAAPIAPTARGIPLAKGGGGRLARQLIEDVENPFILVQDMSGQFKPQFHEFRPRLGKSTVPMLMLGHPDDVPGGRLFMCEASIHERKVKEEKRRKAEERNADEGKRKRRREKPSAPPDTTRPAPPPPQPRQLPPIPPSGLAEIEAVCGKVCRGPFHPSSLWRHRALARAACIPTPTAVAY
jgi:hypothetical protein